MEVELFHHRNSDLMVQYDKFFSSDYSELISIIRDISDEDLKKQFNIEKSNKLSIKSLASAINMLLKERLTEKKWQDEVGLFKEPPYDTSNKSRWRLDFAKNEISVEVAFNHQEATAHNIMKPVLASELNHVKKQMKTRLGIIIVATQDMKKKGNFDGAIGTFESFQEYFKPYNNIISTPIILIGLKAPKTFFIDKTTKAVVTI